MSFSMQEYQTLKTQIKAKEKEQTFAEATLSNLMKRLKEEFGCSTKAQAMKLLRKLKKESDLADEQLSSTKKQFQKDWGNFVDEED